MELIATFQSQIEDAQRIPVGSLLESVVCKPCAGTSLAYDRLPDPAFGVLHARLVADLGGTRVFVTRTDDPESGITTFATEIKQQSL